MSEMYVCDDCFRPTPGEECPLHGPAAVRALQAALARSIDATLARDQMAQGVADAARRCAESSENDKSPCRCCGDEEPT